MNFVERHSIVARFGTMSDSENRSTARLRESLYGHSIFSGAMSDSENRFTARLAESLYSHNIFSGSPSFREGL
jgi:hypothetical protein